MAEMRRQLSGKAGSSSDALLPVRIQIMRPNNRVTNCITTSKYTPLNFVYKCIYELLSPFKRFANFFYLCVGALQTITYLNPGGFPSTWASLTVILTVDLYVLAKDDLARHRADRQTNMQPVSIISHDESDQSAVIERKATWGDVVVGDVVRVQNKEAFPADMILLRGSNPPGTCWVSTKALDGESDMKLRLAPAQGLIPNLAEEDDSAENEAQTPGQPPSVIRSMSDVTSGANGEHDLGSQLQWEHLRGELKCEEPNDKVNDFMGELVLESGARLPVGPNNMLLRGCLLQNTDWVLGLVVATGTDTKINYGSAASSLQKQGIVSKSLNKMVMLEISLCAFMCLIGALFSWHDYGVGPEEPWYLNSPGDDLTTIFQNPVQLFMMFFLILYSMLPATLFVSASFIYLKAGANMANDLDMYHKEADEPCQVRQMTLLDELGQVSHIFSDKTGTLTSNHMEFRRMLIDGTSYGVGETAISISLRQLAKASPMALGHDYSKPGEVLPTADTSAIKLREEAIPTWAGCRAETSTFVSFDEAADTPSLFESIVLDSEDGKRRRELLIHLAVNQSVLLDDGKLSASSPDELAFVAAAEYFGLEFSARNDAQGVIQVLDKRLGVTHTIKLYAIFAYESSRKRMSVVVELPPALLAQVSGTSPIRVYTKGQDSVLLAALKPGSRGSEPAAMDRLAVQLNEWADVALRTLVFAKRELDRAEFDEWYSKYEEAAGSPAEMMKKRAGQPNAINDLEVALEQDQELQGATAIEDKLQDGVPEILADLRKAGIKLWMLTGDKVGTAKNIAMACNILPTNADILELTTETYPVLGEVSAIKMVEVQKTVHHVMEDALPAEAKAGGIVARFIHRARKKLGDKKAEEESREALAAVIKEQTDKLDAKHPGLKQVRAALELRLRKMDEMIKAAKAAGGRIDALAPAAAEEKDFCLVVDEAAIEYCGTLCKDALAQVGDGARSVVACRARKDQKAELLQIIRRYVPSSCCLAIGDGANDVAMIKAGQIGVGIIGKEGMAAVNNSDFAIGQFRFLRGLLFVHGRSNYRRMALFYYYVLYKGTVLPAAIFMYNAANTLSSANNPYITLFFVMLYAILLTVLPIIVTTIYDMDVPKSVAASTPELYTVGIRRLHFNLRGFLWWTLDALFAAFVAIFLPIFCVTPEGNGMYAISYLSMFLLTMGVNVRLYVEIYSWSILEWLANGFSVGLLIVVGFLMSYTAFPRDNGFTWDYYNYFLQRFWPRIEWWLVFILGTFLFALPILTVRGWDAVRHAPPPSKQSLRKPSLQEEPAKTRRKSLMAVPPEEEIAKEERQQIERTGAERKSVTAAVPLPQVRGFAFSSSDNTNQLMWERHNESRQSLLQHRKSGSARDSTGDDADAASGSRASFGQGVSSVASSAVSVVTAPLMSVASSIGSVSSAASGGEPSPSVPLTLSSAPSPSTTDPLSSHLPPGLAQLIPVACAACSQRSDAQSPR